MPRKLPSRAAPAALVAAALPTGATARGADGVRYADIPADAYAVVAQLRAPAGPRRWRGQRDPHGHPGEHGFGPLTKRGSGACQLHRGVSFQAKYRCRLGR